MSCKRCMPWPVHEGGDDDTFLKRLRTERRKDSTVVVRVEPECKEFKFLLYPLVTHSVYFKMRIEPMVDEVREESTLIIDMPDFVYGVSIFKIVHEFCCGVMERNAISTANVVKLFAASEFLDVKNLKNRILEFLEQEVFISWGRTLKVLATFSSDDLSSTDLRHTQGSSLFDRCTKAIFTKLASYVHATKATYSFCGLSCKVDYLLQVAQFLPENVAERVFQSIMAAPCAFDFSFFALILENIHKYIICSCIKVRQQIEGDPRNHSAVVVNLCPTGKCDLVRWREKLPHALPNVSKRSLFILYLTKFMHLDMEVTGQGGFYRTSHLDLSFVCGLLVEASDLVTRASNRAIAQGLEREIVYLEKSLCQCLARGLAKERDNHKKPRSHCLNKLSNSAHHQDSILRLLMNFEFATLRSILRSFRSFESDAVNILPVAKILDRCIALHLQEESLTLTETALLYKEFPNELRPSHAELYLVYEHVLRRKDLSSHEALELVELLDYDKLSDEIVERLFEEFQLELGPRFVKRFMAMQLGKLIDKEKNDEEFVRRRQAAGKQTMEIRLDEALSRVLEMERLGTKLGEALNSILEMEQLRILQTAKSDQELTNLREQLIVQTKQLISESDGKRLLESERDSLIEGKRLVELETDASSESKRLVESQRDALQHDLEEEREKTTCQICFERPRDALYLPCLHFLYCSKCVEQYYGQSRTCPTCRCFTNGVLKCNLSG